MTKAKTVSHSPTWLDVPEEHDFSAAESHLRLIHAPRKARHA